MALYDNLPVYKTSYDLLLRLFQVCQNMERDFKFTIGENLKKEIIELIINVYRANSRDSKQACITYNGKNYQGVETLRATSYAKYTELQSAVCVTDIEMLRATSLQL